MNCIKKINIAAAEYQEAVHSYKIREIELTTKLEILDSSDKKYSELIEKITNKHMINIQEYSNKTIEEKQKSLFIKNEQQYNAIKSSFASDILSPLKRDIELLYKNIDQEIHSRIKIETILGQVTKGYEKMHNAFTGNVKVQGNWGEIVLERMLEISGLRKDYEFKSQHIIHSDEDGQQRYVPDILIMLPENKNMIIDSKVSLKNYYNYINSDKQEEKDLFLSKYILNIKSHIDNVEKYLKVSSTAEFIVMFFPVESSFSSVMNKQPDLLEYAWNKKVTLAGPSSLFAILKTISSIWKTEQQNKNTRKIIDETAKLYDKFVSFMEEMEKISKAIENARISHEGAMNKLSRGKGNILNRISLIKRMGIVNKKKLSDYVENIIEDDEDNNLIDNIDNKISNAEKEDS